MTLRRLAVMARDPSTMSERAGSWLRKATQGARSAPCQTHAGAPQRSDDEDEGPCATGAVQR